MLRRLLALALLAVLPVTVSAQMTIAGNMDGNGNITYVGSTMTGHLGGDGNFTVNGLTQFNITSPSNGQCLSYSTMLSAWINGACAGGGGGLPSGWTYSGTSTDLKLNGGYSQPQFELTGTGGIWRTFLRGDEIDINDGTNHISPGGNTFGGSQFNAIQHFVNHVHLYGANAELFFTDVSQGPLNEEWGMDYSGGTLALHTNGDNGGSPVNDVWELTRSGTTITSYLILAPTTVHLREARDQGEAERGYTYNVPNDGDSITIGTTKRYLILEPAGTLASLTVTFPANGVDGQLTGLSTTQTVTTLTLTPNSGQSLGANTPTTLAAGGALSFIYRLANDTWYRVD